MASPEVLSRLEQRAVQAEQMIQVLTKQVGQLQKVAVSALKDELRRENLELLQEVDKLKTCLLSHEKTQGITQYYDFTSQMTPSSSACDPQIQADVISPPVQASPAPQTNKQNKEKGDKKSEKKEKKAGGGGGKKQEEGPVDVSRLDFRVGRIVSAKKHPDADTLYVSQVDVGEEKIRTVISGLVRHIPLEEMQNRVVVLLCNLKPANMRGIASEAMIMCASTPDKVEILAPPAGSQPGDLIEFEGYTRNPDAVLNPKKKIFETCAPDLKTDANKVAMYKGIPFTVPGKGIVLSQTMSNVQIK
ncbi:aminoacyl tRNA synthase complex-interacting multifunctional protein 1-like [Homarus americanus]|uniref:aminoacyl tRNA synthase complex-interacting multifunctional protein 1-like n=1 Tax=Homarus americanus TaxID=6706 RepID=UPI001C441AFA|nr:aminoacyl tRNA synthase complex-interacting multifunctional protein 1-like [Homarus americanus]